MLFLFYVSICDDLIVVWRYLHEMCYSTWPYVCGCNPHQACVTSATYTVYTLLFSFWVFFTLHLVFLSEVPFILKTKVITVSINCDHLDKDQLHNEC